MTPARSRWAPGLVAASALLLLVVSGCIERRMLIVTSPPGTKVYLDGVDLDQLGYTAQAFDAEALGLDADAVSPEEARQLEVRVIPFDIYGPREIVLVRPGSVTQRHELSPTPPLTEFFLIDLIFDLGYPGTIRYSFVYRFTLEPVDEADAEARSIAVDSRARRFRAESREALAETARTSPQR